jgi:hypothetical protein
VQSLARNAVDEAAREVASIRRYLEVDDHSGPPSESVEAASLRRYLDDIEADNHNDPLFRGCIEAVEIGQSVNVRIGENRAKYDEIKKHLERQQRGEQSNSNCSKGHKKDGDMSVPLFVFR